MASIELQHISKSYPGGVEAVRDVSLQVRDQELFVLLGPSGCGKTTTLRVIAGLETATQGRLLLGGQDVTSLPPHRRKLALLFQSPALYPHLTVRQNLVFGRRAPYNSLHWWSRRQAADGVREEVAATARLLRIESLLDRKPAELSGGERQRVALGRALLRQPAVFLLDEPLAHVDPALRAQLRQELKCIQRQQGGTLLWVTHDHAEALALADRIGVMQAGQLLQVGTPVEIYERPASSAVATLVGQPAMNLVPGRIGADGERRCLETSAGDIVVPVEWTKHSGREVWLGIRPRDVRLGQDGLRLRVRAIEYAEARWHVSLMKPDAQARVSDDASLARRASMTPCDDCLELTAEAESSLGLEMGAEVAVAWDWQKVHLFDRATGVRIDAALG